MISEKERRLNSNTISNQLPKQLYQRQTIVRAIKQQLQKLNQSPQFNQNSIKILQLRKRLILSCKQLNQNRISNLQQIFQHYCTHIFKTGKFMTFQRLQYERIHLTMDRFFTFVKDFALNSVIIADKQTQIIQKAQIVKIFKKISSNCRDLSLEQFIQIIQKIAVLYYDQKQQFAEKKNRRQAIKRKRLEKYKAKMYVKLRQKNPIKKTQRSEIQSPEKLVTENNEKQQQQQQKQQNDDLINELMKDNSIQNANDQISKMIEHTLKEVNDLEQEEKKQQQRAQHEKRLQEEMDPLKELLLLTDDQKIQYFYQYLSIDNISQYRKKMSSLNLPIFQNPKIPKSRSNFELQVVQPTISNSPQNPRIIDFKEKLEERKEKAKENSKKILRESQRPEIRNKPKVTDLRDEMDRSKSLTGNINPDGKNVRILSGPVSLAMINKVSFDELKIPKFNPSLLFVIQESDRKFLGQYMLPKRVLNSGNDKQSKSVVDQAKKRVTEVQKIQKLQQNKLKEALSKRNYKSQKIVNKF